MPRPYGKPPAKQPVDINVATMPNTAIVVHYIVISLLLENLGVLLPEVEVWSSELTLRDKE